MRSCSALTRNCAYVTTLSKLRKRSRYVEQTAEEGTRFGALVQAWIEGRPEPTPDPIDSPWCWFEDLRAQWHAPAGAACEIAIGLSKNGTYVPVVEVYPHFYCPSHDTDGAAFLLPAAGDRECLATAGRLDVGWVNGNVAIVLDMKRSAWRYGNPEYVPQLMALGCAWALRHDLEFVQTGLYGAKDGVFVWSQEIQRVADILPDVLEMCGLPEDKPIPGEWCASCYERKQCPASVDFA